MELASIKKNLWKKWRGKTEILKRKCTIPKEKDQLLRRLDEIEGKIEEYRKRKDEQLRKKEVKKEEWKRRNKMIVEDHWGMLRWLHQYIEENKMDWERRRKREKEEVDEEYEKWKGMNEDEMIDSLMTREDELEMEKARKAAVRKERKDMRQYMEENSKLEEIKGEEVIDKHHDEKLINPKVTIEGEVVENPQLDSHNHNLPNIPEYDASKEEKSEVRSMKKLMMRKEEMLQKRKEWKEEHSNTHSKVIIVKRLEEFENIDEGGMVRDPLLDSKHQPLLNSVE